MPDRSFMKALLHGDVDEGLLFPWSGPTAREVDAVRARLDPVRRFFEREVDSARIDAEEQIPGAVLRGLGELGLFGLLVPVSRGGAGFTHTGYARVLQEMAGLDASVALTVAAHGSLAVRGLVRFGSATAQAQYLPRLATGEALGAGALAGEASGGDEALIEARPDVRGGYVLRGTKTWVTNGGLANLFLVFARTSSADGEAQLGTRAFVVERARGVETGPNQRKLGVRGSSTTDLTLRDACVPPAGALDLPGRGQRVAAEITAGARLAVATACVGGCKRLLKLAVGRCRERRTFGRPIGEFGLIKDKVAAMMADTWALESMTYLTSGMLDRGVSDVEIEAAICKVFGSEVGARVAHQAAQIAGGSGYMSSHAFERWLRDVRVHLVLGGGNDFLRTFVALGGIRSRSEATKAGADGTSRPFGRLGALAWGKRRAARARLTKVHLLLDRERGVFEQFVYELGRTVDGLVRRYGRDLDEMQYTQKRIADVAIDLYAVAACVARASQAIERRGEDGARREADLTRIFALGAEKRMARTLAEVDRNDDELRKEVASQTYDDGGYPFEPV